MHSSASLGIPPDLPAALGPVLGDFETVRLPLPGSVLAPLAASKRPVGALSPTDVALFPTSPCTAEGSLKEASHTPDARPFPPEVNPATHPAGFPPDPPRSTERAREPLKPFLDRLSIVDLVISKGC